MMDHLTLEELRHFLDAARAFSILEEEPGMYWIRIQSSRVPEAFARGLAPFSALGHPIACAGQTTHQLTRGTTFVPLIR